MSVATFGAFVISRTRAYRCAHAGHLLRTDLLRAQAQSRCAIATKQHDGQITSDFPKSCQAPESKIFRFRSYPNQPHNSAHLAADEGRSRTSRTRGGMRWTLRVRQTC